MKKKLPISRGILYVILIAYAVVCLFPIIWTFVSSLKSNTEILMDTMSFPKTPQWQNYTEAWEDGKMLRYFVNTLLVALGGTAINLLVTSMAVYILARVMPINKLYMYFVIGLMVPVYVIMLPLFKIYNVMHLTNTFIGLTIIYAMVNIPQTFFILYGFMKDGIPLELEESAMIDGCTRVGVFTRIILPLSGPGLATVGIFEFLFSWNEYLLPLILMSGDNKVLSVAIRDFQTSYATNYGAMTARLILSFIPVIIIYVLFQRKIIAGVTAGSVKG